MSSQSMTVLVVSADRTLLRHISKFLEVFGYGVGQAADAARAADALAARRPDFLIVDGRLSGRGGLDICRSAAARGDTCTLLLCSSPSADDVSTALAAGVDDFLARPLVYGELLSRLRTGARWLAQQRRRRERRRTDPATGLPGRAALLARLEGGTCADVSPHRPLSCIALDIDHFSRIAAAQGQPAAGEALRVVAQWLQEIVGSEGYTASLGKDRFAVLLENYAAAEAAQWADKLRAVIAEHFFDLAGGRCSLTASFGVAEAREAPPLLAEVVERAETALAQAKASGRDCVVRLGELDSETNAWAELASPGRLFERTVARDVMIPSAACLREDDLVVDAEALLAVSQTEAVPVVDGRGKLAGVFCKGEASSPSSGSRARLVRDAMNTAVHVEEEFTTFEQVVGFFSENESPYLVVVSRGRPTGLVTRDSLAALSQAVTQDSFSAASIRRGAGHLVVAEAP